MKKILLAFLPILTLLGVVSTVNVLPAEASECTIPGSPKNMVGVHRNGCVRVTITYCLLNQDNFWLSWWVQDTVDPGSDADTAQYWRKWPNSSTWVKGGEDQNSADWYPNSGYVFLQQSHVGNAGNIQFYWKFSDEPKKGTFYPEYLSTSSC